MSGCELGGGKENGRTKNFATTALRAGTAVGRVARARRDGRASSEARSHGVRPSCRPLRCCCCPSRAYWTPPVCCTQVAQTKLVEHKHHGCCWLLVVPVHHEQPRHDASEPSQLARRARARRRGWCAGQLALQPFGSSPSLHVQHMHIDMTCAAHAPHAYSTRQVHPRWLLC